MLVICGVVGGLKAVVERTLLGDEETVALLEGDAVSVDKNVSILFRIDCVVLSRALFLPFLPEIYCHRVSCASSFVFSFFHRALRDRCRGILEFLPRVLVIGREASRVCGFGDLGALDLLQGVDALALVVESVHQMHIDGWMCIFV